MLEEFKTHIHTHLNVLTTSKLIIAISGGVDSVVLAHLCHKLNLKIALAHCNFNLRGIESDTDEQFVLNLAETLGVEAFTQTFDTEAYATLHKMSIQMAARALRYQWFLELATQLQYQYILTAHHADDNVETFLINFIRGTGLNGLTGIPMVKDTIVRPLLGFSRERIMNYATKQQLQWREDSSNTSQKYLRNKLRHEIIPLLKTINPQLTDSFKNTITHLKGTAQLVAHHIDTFKNDAIAHTDALSISYKISVFKATTCPNAYLYEMFQAYGFTAWQDILDLLDAETGKYVSSQTHRLIKHREFLILTQENYLEQTHPKIIINDTLSNIETPIGLLRFQVEDKSTLNTNTTIFVDVAMLKYPLVLRYWQKTDSFQPIGMNGKKKISKYLKDEKVSPVEKANTWVLCSNEDIVWVVGRRADDRFKVTKTTPQILKIELQHYA